MKFSQNKFFLLSMTTVFFIAYLNGCTPKNKIASLPKEEKLDEKIVDKKTPVIQNLNTNSPISSNEDIQNQVTPVVIGNVITENQSSLAFLNSGTIEKILVKAGDHVKHGQILATLVNTQETLDVQASEIKVKQKELTLDLERKKLNRIKEQFNAGIVNKATLEVEKNTVDSMGLDLAESKNELEGKRYNLKMTKISAPYDGVISQKNKSVGDFVPSGTIIFQITQNKNMEIYAQIPSIYFNKLTSGMKLNIVSSSNKNDVGEIEIRKVIPVLDKNSRTFDLYAKIITFKGQLNPGDYVEIKL